MIYMRSRRSSFRYKLSHLSSEFCVTYIYVDCDITTIGIEFAFSLLKREIVALGGPVTQTVTSWYLQYVQLISGAVAPSRISHPLVCTGVIRSTTGQAVIHRHTI